MKCVLVLMTVIFSDLSFAAKSSCRVNLDVGKIEGFGSTIHEARKNASIECFNRRLALHEKFRSFPDGETADMIIDSCVNITCEQ